MSTNRRRFFLLVAGLTVGVLLFAVPHPAAAGIFDLLSPAGLISQVIRIVAAVLSFIVGIAYMVGSYLVEFILNLNYGILNTQNGIVDVGWRIVRDVANLGFVLVIVVMAFATILRIETYGAKKLLVRLIAAAVIVNFSLTIAGVFIDFSHSLTRFFLEGGLGASATKELVLDLGAAFGPQRFSLGDQNPTPPDPSEQTGFFTSFSTQVLVSIAGGIFSVVFMAIATLVMVTLALMLLIRYLVLSFLLILAPLAWLFWVIPAFKSQFTKWWSKFFEWVFFAPAVSFFIYLSIVSVKALKSVPLPTLGGIPGVLTTVISQGAQMVVLAGIMIGGIIVAQKMGITGAKGAVGFLQKTGAKVRGAAAAYTRRKAMQAGAAGLASKYVAGAATWMQGKRGLRKIGFALGGQSEVMRQQLIADADKRLAKYSDAYLAKNLDTLSAPEQVAAKERLAKNDTVGLIKDRKGNGNVLNNVTGKNKELFESYYGKDPRQWKAFEVAAGMNVASADAIRAGNETQLKQEWAMGSKDLKPEEITKLPVNNIFNGKDRLSDIGIDDENKTRMLREATIEGIGERVPGDLAKLFNKVKPVGFESLYKAVDKFKEKLEGIFFIETAKAGPKVSTPEQQAAKRKLDTVSNVLAHAPSLRFYSGMYEGGGAPPGAAPPPPTVPPSTRP